MDSSTKIDQHEPDSKKDASSEDDLVSGVNTELDNFVRNNRSDAIEYLKMLLHETEKSALSFTRYTFATWIFIAMFYTISFKVGEIKVEYFLTLNREVLLKLLPAAITMSFYIMLTRLFIHKERGVVAHELAARLFPGEHIDYSSYIRPSHFMLSERLLNRFRPNEIFINNAMLLFIIQARILLPLIAGLYAYWSSIIEFGFYDQLFGLSLAVGIATLMQSVVILRGVRIITDQDRKSSGVIPWRDRLSALQEELNNDKGSPISRPASNE